MLDEKITTVLFDLDGTLLPMDEAVFTKVYFGLLTKKAAEHGYTDPKAVTDAVWAGTGAMVKNDGTKPNCQRFWDTFAGIMGEAARDMRPVFDGFYANEFHGARRATGENPWAKRAVDGLKAQGREAVLATNPIFPMVGVETRLSWLGLSEGDFSRVTSYENSSFCKPNPAYFGEILEKLGKRPEECLMVGNDAEEDLAAREQGIGIYLVTDCLINKKGRDISCVPRGSFKDFLKFAGL